MAFASQRRWRGICSASDSLATDRASSRVNPLLHGTMAPCRSGFTRERARSGISLFQHLLQLFQHLLQTSPHPSPNPSRLAPGLSATTYNKNEYVFCLKAYLYRLGCTPAPFVNCSWRAYSPCVACLPVSSSSKLPAACC
ncbi:hypothetical protein C1882_20215 [Pseudomonas sp. FW305-E2]|nr:hypothetical protein C1882_20215 [Pseudomonas sp. FW305-E2]